MWKSLNKQTCAVVNDGGLYVLKILLNISACLAMTTVIILLSRVDIFIFIVGFLYFKVGVLQTQINM